jgi:hypothetical protein
VCRYDAASLAAEFAPDLELCDSATELHRTPWGKPQPFQYCLMQRTDRSDPPRR